MASSFAASYCPESSSESLEQLISTVEGELPGPRGSSIYHFKLSCCNTFPCAGTHATKAMVPLDRHLPTPSTGKHITGISTIFYALILGID